MLDISAADVASVELSTDNGVTWNVVASYTNMTVATWTQVQVGLGAQAALGRVRFRVVTDGATAGDGWIIDDVSISDLPAAVVLEQATSQPPPNEDEIELKWSRNADVSFGSYQLRRDTQPGVDLSDNLVRTITDQIITADTDSGLATQTTYYYKVFVVNPHGAVAASNELSATTFAPGGLVAYPFFDDMEGGKGNWDPETPWALTTETSYSGTTSWTDSPGSSYGNSLSTSLRISINLGAAVMPVLSFRHIYSVQQNADWIFVEVSSNAGVSWRQVFFATGGVADWREARVDLGDFAGLENVMIRFRLQSNSNTPADGWHIDDVRIGETTAGPISYPFYDNMQGGTGSWISSSWGLEDVGHNDVTSWHDSPVGNYALDTWSELVLSNVVDLRGAVNPMLTFWHKYTLYDETCCYINEHDYGRVYVSNFYGQTGTWEQVAFFTGTQNAWTRAEIDLSKYVGSSSVRIKFVMDDNRDTNGGYGEQNHQRDGWYIDDVRLLNAPRDVVLSVPTDATMHGTTLGWTQNTESNFGRYEIYRSTGTVSLNSTLVASIEDQTTTQFMDVYSILQPDFYHYRMWVLDDLARYSPGSNEVVATYTVPQVSFPFFDDMEGGTGDWEWGAPWGLITTGDTGGSPDTSWTDSPLGPYADNTNAALTTNIDLALAASPVLTFRHRFAMEQATDFGYVEISTDIGVTWTKVMTLTGVEGWNRERLNLSGYTGQVIGLRFRLVSDGAGRADGWFIDDVRIDDEAIAASYPFFDDVEGGPGVWFYDSPWGRSQEASYSGVYSWTDSPNSGYADNASTSLRMTIDLSPALMPVLSFRHQFSLQENGDYGYVEVSNNGGASWRQIYFVTGGTSKWLRELVDLGEWAGQANVIVRFRMASNGSTTSNGWLLDDLRIAETPAGPVGYPFFDDMEGGTGDWISGSWELAAEGASGIQSWTDSPQGNYTLDTWSELVLSNVIDLSGANNPKLIFWHKYNLYDETCCYINEHDYGRVYISNFYGQGGTWQQLAYYSGTQSEWTKVQIDLSNWVGLSSVRIKFVLDDNRDTNGGYGEQNHQSDGWYIDSVRIGEKDETAPAAIANLAASGFTPSSAELNWTAVGDDGNSGTATLYELRYSTSPITDASWASATQVSGEPAPQPAGFSQGFTVTGLASATLLYFAIKVSDEEPNTSALSNVASGSTLGAGAVNVTVDAPTYVLVSGDFTATIRVSRWRTSTPPATP